MKSLVIDGSTTLGFVLHDEKPAVALKAQQAIASGLAVYVPSHWWLETANGLLIAERRKRISQSDATEALHLLQALPLITDSETALRCRDETAHLARQHTLTIYDAAYLELAMRLGSTLATTDEALARAARSAGTPVLG